MSGAFWRRLPQRLRALHLATSLSAALVIGFYGLSGLVALHQDTAADADPSPRMAPASAMATTATLAAWLAAQLPSGSALRQVSVVSDEDSMTASIPIGDGCRELQADRHNGAVIEHEWHPLPLEAPRTRRALAAWFASRLGGDPDLPEDAQDRLAAQDTLCLASVWSVRTITVETGASIAVNAPVATNASAAGRWSERRDARPLGAAMADLHRGRHASWLQRRIMDLAACALLASTLTGLGMAAYVLAKRPLLAATALSLGTACLIALILGR